MIRSLAAAFTLAVIGGESAPAWSACLTTTQVVAPGQTFTNTGCISTTNVDGVDAGPASTVINSSAGSITLTTNNLLTSAINGTGNSNLFTNNGVINVASGNLSGNGMNVSGSSNTMTNNGTINLLGGLNGITDGIFASSNTGINNGTINALTGGFGIELSNQNDTAINNGSIMLGGDAFGLFSASGLSTNNVTLTNNGSISYASGSNGAAIECSVGCTISNSATGTITLGANTSSGIFIGAAGTVTNDGQITVTGTGSSAINTDGDSNSVTNRGTVLVSGPSSFGIQVNDANTLGTVSTFSNPGTITVTGQGSFGVAFATPFLLFFTPSPSTGNQFFNTGTVKAGPGAIAIGDIAEEGVSPTLNSVFNSGIIDGQIALSQGTNESLTNSGLITISYPGAGIIHSINGTFTQTATGTLALRVDASGGNDKLVVSGVANLAGTLQVLAQPGGYAQNTTYTIVTASNGVNGTFANVSSNPVLLTPSVSYDPDDVFLTLKRANFCSFAATFNQCSVGNALQNASAGNALVAALLGQTSPASVQQAFDALSGEIHASVQSVILDQSLYARDAMLSRMRQFQFEFGGIDGALVSLGGGGPALAYVGPPGNDDMLALGYAGNNQPPFPIKAPPPQRREPDLVYWVQGVGAWGRLGGDGNSATVTDTLGGFFGGFDKRFSDWRVGVLLGYTGADASMPTRGSSANIDTAHFGVYAGTGWGAWRLRTGGELAWSELSTDRSIIFPGFTDSATAHYGADEGQAFGELGYGMSFGRIAAEPFGGLGVVTLHTDSFTESGGVAALNGAGANDTVGYTTLGARAATILDWHGMTLTPRVSAAWQHAFGEVTPTAALSFQSVGTAFTVAGVPIARDAALVNAGTDLALNRHATVGIAYVGQLSGRGQDNSVNGTFRWKF